MFDLTFSQCMFVCRRSLSVLCVLSHSCSDFTVSSGTDLGCQTRASPRHRDTHIHTCFLDLCITVGLASILIHIHPRRSATSYFYMLSEVLLDTLIAYLFVCHVMSVAIFYGMSCCFLRRNVAQDTLSAWQRVRTHCIHPVGKQLARAARLMGSVG